MTPDKIPYKDYSNWVSAIKQKITVTQQQAHLIVNNELLGLYWFIGEALALKETEWGDKFIENLARDLKVEFPDSKGYSKTNLKYMRRWYSFYSKYVTIGQQAVDQIDTIEANVFQTESSKVIPQEIDDLGQQLVDLNLNNLIPRVPWGHHLVILTKVDNIKEAAFYLNQTIENNWSRSILSRHIESKLFERQGKSITNFKSTLPFAQADLAQELIKNPYNFDFLNLSKDFREAELEKALISNIQKFILELGKGYAFVGNQKNVIVGGDDFFLDLLFFNYKLNCFFVIELKVGDFKPEYAGKLNFYVTTVNEQLKEVHHNPTIGLLLCKTPNETIVKYSLATIVAPLGVSDYVLSKAIPDNLEDEIPSIEALEAEIDKEYEALKSPTEKRLDELKQKLTGIKGKEIKTTFTSPILSEIFDNSLVPLFNNLFKKLKVLDEMFIKVVHEWGGFDYNNSHSNDPKIKAPGIINEISQLRNYWSDENFIKNNKTHYFIYILSGFKSVGADTFDVHIQINYTSDIYSYSFALNNYNNSQPFLKKLYHEQLTTEEIDKICDLVYNYVIDNIENNLDRIKKQLI